MTRIIVFLILVQFTGLAWSLEQPPALQFDVVRFEVTGANPLGKAHTTEILKPYLGRHYSLDGLSAAIDEFERELKRKGYSFHRVILEPQSLKSGVVTFKVYEFTLGQLKVSGQKYFNEANIRRSLPNLQIGQSPNTRLLNMSLALANSHPDKSVQMVFKEGEAPNTLDIDLNVADKSPHTTFVSLANTGTEESGENRLGVGYQYSNLFNRDHIASINYSTSVEQPENVAQWVVSYSMPFYSIADQLAIYYSDSEIETSAPIENSNLSFDITGAGTVFGLRYKYTLKKIKGYNQSVTFGYDDKYFDNRIVVGTTPTFGSNELTSKPLSITYDLERKKPTHPYRFSIGYYQNTYDDQDAYDKEIRATGNSPDTDWSLFRYNGSYDLLLEKSMVKFILEGQETSDLLVSAEQFGVGGATSVRGYNERDILGDKGQRLSVEYWSSRQPQIWRWLAFYDWANVQYIEDIGTEILTQNPSSVGAGFRYHMNRHFRVAMDAAVALEDVGTIENGDARLHFNMVYIF